MPLPFPFSLIEPFLPLSILEVTAGLLAVVVVLLAVQVANSGDKKGD